MAGRRNITYIKPAEPSFLAKFKRDVGYKEGTNVDTKREVPSLDDLSDKPENDDEKPVVVVLKDGDLTEEEAEFASKEMDKQKKEEGTNDSDAADGKIIFKKPSKRTHSDPSDMNVSSSKKIRDKGKKLNKAEGRSGKKVKNSSLLSFGEDEEEETYT